MNSKLLTFSSGFILPEREYGFGDNTNLPALSLLGFHHSYS